MRFELPEMRHSDYIERDSPILIFLATRVGKPHRGCFKDPFNSYYTGEGWALSREIYWAGRVAYQWILVVDGRKLRGKKRTEFILRFV